MDQVKKIGLVFLIIASVSLIYLTWYSVQPVKEEARPIEVNDPKAGQHVLIATQENEFLKNVALEVIGQLRPEPIYIRVIDVSSLAYIQEEEWSAIVVLNTQEHWRPPKEAEAGLERAQRQGKMMVLSTSQTTHQTIEKGSYTLGSDWKDVRLNAAEIVDRIKRILETPGQPH
jgi:hypothetical protein